MIDFWMGHSEENVPSSLMSVAFNNLRQALISVGSVEGRHS